MIQGHTFLIRSLLMAGAVAMGACSTVENLLFSQEEDVEYKAARSLPPLEIPPDLTGSGEMPMDIPGEETSPRASTTYSEYQRQITDSGAANSQSLPVDDAVTTPLDGAIITPIDDAVTTPVPQPIAVQQNREPVLERNPQGVGRIVLQEGFPRAWREIGRGLNAAEIEIEDRDRSRGIYFIRYLDSEVGGKGWLASMKFWGSDEPELTSFLLMVEQETEEKSQVTVFDAKENLLSSEVSFEILSSIYQKLK